MTDPAYHVARDRPVRVALVGYGRAGRTFHTPLLLATPGFDLAVVVTSRPDDVRRDLPRAIIVPSPADAWTDPTIDLIVIATPTATHVDLAAAALDAGKHVLVDKPLAHSLDGARKLASAAARANRVLTTFQNRRWDGDFFALEQIVRSGALGTVTHLASHIDRYRPDVRNRWRERAGIGSGVWNDLGPHLADQALRLFGLPHSVSAHLARQRAGAETDDWAHVILDYGHLTVILHASMLAAAPSPRFIVHGSRASWIKRGLDPQEFRLAAGMGVDVGAAPSESAVLVDGTSGTEPATPIPAGDYGRLYATLRDALRGEAGNPVPPVQAIATTAIVETASRSAVERRVLPLPLTDEEHAAFTSDRRRSANLP